jgi:hypothetical protein
MWDKNAALKQLEAQAGACSLGRCAEFVRRSVEAGGLRLQRCASAKDYDASLRAAGFVPLRTEAYEAGDIIVIQPIHSHPHGHMAMFNGAQWVSDFRQLHGYYPGPGYRSVRPAFTVYRYASEAIARPYVS